MTHSHPEIFKSKQLDNKCDCCVMYFYKKKTKQTYTNNLLALSLKVSED